jgi:hypothetical protein
MRGEPRIRRIDATRAVDVVAAEIEDAVLGLPAARALLPLARRSA